MIKKIITSTMLLPMLSVGLYATPVLASHWSSSDTDVDIDVDNNAYVKNVVNTSASTGGNTANGGNATSNAYGKGADSDADGGNGGVIVTGNADAISTVLNDVNSTNIKVKASCGCKGDLDVDVDVDNSATVKNYLNTDASTGGNTANGGDATSKAKSYSSHSHHHSSGPDSDADGGDGGTVVTGAAYADGAVGNLVNETVIRIRR